MAGRVKSAGRVIIPLCVLLALVISAAFLARIVIPAKAAGGGGEEGMEKTKEWTKSGKHVAVPSQFSGCTECHGKDASGSGPRHTEFIPQPANLTLVHDSPDMMYSIVKNGIQGTAMGSHPNMSRADFDKIRTWIESLAPNMQRQWQWPYEYFGQTDVRPDNWEKLSAFPDNDMGRTIFVTSCAGCHGMDGKGDPDDLKNPHIWPKPANLTARNSEIGRLYYIISNGRPGTMMGPQKPKFQSPGARWALAKYVHSLYDPKSTDTVPTGMLTEYKNPYSIQDEEVVERGRILAGLECTYCHGGGMAGTWLAPDLTDRKWRYGGGTDNAIFQVVSEGIDGKLMPPHTNLPDDDKWKIITYLRHSGGLPDPVISLMQGEEVGKH